MGRCDTCPPPTGREQTHYSNKGSGAGTFSNSETNGTDPFTNWHTTEVPLLLLRNPGSPVLICFHRACAPPAPGCLPSHAVAEPVIRKVLPGCRRVPRLQLRGPPTLEGRLFRRVMAARRLAARAHAAPFVGAAPPQPPLEGRPTEPAGAELQDEGHGH